MYHKILRSLGPVMVAVLFIGCATASAPLPSTDFAPVAIDATHLVRKVDGFVVVMDASQSMAETCKGTKKLDLAREIVARFNRTLPEAGYQAGLRRFGQVNCPFARRTEKVYGVTGYTTAGLAQGLDQVNHAGGSSPLEMAIDAAGADLKGVDGKLALIVVSDGKDMDDAPIQAAKALLQTYPGRICIYTVQIGMDAAGKRLLEQVAAATGCGAAFAADAIMTPAAMANFVKQVFFNERLDSDGDGVYDDLDRCPGTPKGVKVDAVGCEIKAAAGPKDSDGDGVMDPDDACPGTPKGAEVDTRGCWVLEGVYFKTDSSKIDAYFAERLDKVATVMKNNPAMKMGVYGHTDNIASAAYNQKLSERRAKAVSQYLIGKGVAAERLKVEAYGLTKPAVANDTAHRRALNRRVELVPLS